MVNPAPCPTALYTLITPITHSHHTTTETLKPSTPPSQPLHFFPTSLAQQQLQPTPASPAMKRTKKPHRSKIKRRAWHSTHKENTTTPTRRNGDGTYRQGLGAVALAAAGNEPASANLHRLLTILASPNPSVAGHRRQRPKTHGTSGSLRRPRPHPATSTRPETSLLDQPARQGSHQRSRRREEEVDDLQDVKSYLATMDHHVSRMETSLGLPTAPNDPPVERALEHRPSTSPTRLRPHHRSTSSGTPLGTPLGTAPLSTNLLSRTQSASTLHALQHQHTQHFRRTTSLRPSTTTTRTTHSTPSTHSTKPGPTRTRQDQLRHDQTRSLAKSQRKRQRQLSAQRTRSTPSTTLSRYNLRVDVNTGVPVRN